MNPAEAGDQVWEHSSTGGFPDYEASVLARIYAAALQKCRAQEQDSPDSPSTKGVRNEIAEKTARG